LGRIVVIEVERPLRRLPYRLGVAALAARARRAHLAVRLILGVAAVAGAGGAEVRPQPLPVRGRVAARAVGARVLALQRPARQRVIELRRGADRHPAHRIEAAAAVLLVAQPARPALHLLRRVEADPGVDPLLEVLVVVTAQALARRDLPVALVAR